MGNQLASQSAQLDYYLHDLPGIVYENSLGKGRFLKTLQCIHDEGSVVVKVYIKRDLNQSLKDQAEKLTEIREYFALVEHSNLLPFRRWVETDKAGYIIRQYFVNNLYDRISTRPFLTPIEKKWIVFQLLTALTQTHFYGICHGDIKCENVMVTSWNWIYLSDFASYKPTYIPEDNPADFSFYFDSGGRRTCYLAPERFYGNNQIPEGELTPEMDIFSTGCVIAELFLEGTHIFNFSQLLGYRKGTYDPESVINRISDPYIQEIVKHMIQKDPKKRFSAKKYLTWWSGTAFPTYFPMLHIYISKMMKIDPDDKIKTCKLDFSALVDKFQGRTILLPSELISNKEANQNSFIGTYRSSRDISNSATLKKNLSTTEISVELEDQDPAFLLLMDTNKLVNHLESESEIAAEKSTSNSLSGTPAAREFISGSLEDKDKGSTQSSPRGPVVPIINTETFLQTPNLSNSLASSSGSSSVGSLTNMMNSSLYGSPTNSPVTPAGVINQQGVEGLVIVLDILCSFIPTLRLPSTKLTALELFSSFAKYLDSEIRLQRIVPYIVSLLSEESALVRATAIRTLASVLEKVDTFPPSDSHVFPAYILPALSKFATEEPEELVREAYAETLALLAETAKRFLETSQFFKQNSDISSSDKDILSSQESYDAELTEIQEAFYEVVVEMLTKDTSTAVRRTLLSDITRLCTFFGRQKTNDFLLPLIITFLNDRHDWELRCAFFQNIVGVSAFVGMDSLQLFILPCILQALTDEEEFVIDKAVNSLASLCELGLFRKHVLFEIAEKAAPMLYHPNMWIRYGVIALMAAIASQLKLADIHCFLLPTLRPFLGTGIIDITEQNLLEALKAPVSRTAFDKTMILVFDMISNDNVSDLSESKRRTVALDKSSTAVEETKAPIPFDVALKTQLSDSSSSEEEKEKLWVMRNFIKSATYAKKGKYGRQDDDGHSTSNLTIPVHTVNIPNYGTSFTSSGSSKNLQKLKNSSMNSSSFDMRRSNARNEEWKTLFSSSGGLNSPTVGSLRLRKGSADPPRMKTFFVSNNDTANIKGLPSNFPQRLFPPAPPELGHLITDAPLNGDSLRDWVPKGILVAHLYEHKGPVNQIQVSKDNMFFVSASDDGTVKIWDCMRLEKNVTNRSRCTYSQGGKIKALTILENSHTIASGSDNGSIHIYRVEYATKKDSQLHRYTGVSTIKNIDSAEGAIIGLDHFNTDSQSLLVYGTNKGKIHCMDLRSKNEAWVLNNAPNLGLLTCFVIEPGKNWLVTGTGSGFFTCWDMRFQLPVKTWRHYSKSRIYKLSHDNHISNSSCIFATSGTSNDVSVWDVESGTCKQLIRLVTNNESTIGPNIKNVDQDLSLSNYGMDDLQNPISPSVGNVGIKAIINPSDCPYLLTGGDDKKIRYWDLNNAANSFTICGNNSEQSKPKYNSQHFDNVSVLQEIATSHDEESRNLLHPHKAGPSAPSVNHHESILDLKLLEIPHRMLISAGRDGVVKVWK